ncbi:hypothetical protein Tcan_01708 [Toxocara canis]|uniref:Uncharacterized protein n=1 Tax=Toxocara canis TaxID=6265 RepID=A0A0B2V855_TOXCA|nr:hypothetical protein Tcan_01708 [Toxocara canis]
MGANRRSSDKLVVEEARAPTTSSTSLTSHRNFFLFIIGHLAAESEVLLCKRDQTCSMKCERLTLPLSSMPMLKKALAMRKIESVELGETRRTSLRFVRQRSGRGENNGGCEYVMRSTNIFENGVHLLVVWFVFEYHRINSGQQAIVLLRAVVQQMYPTCIACHQLGRSYVVTISTNGCQTTLCCAHTLLSGGVGKLPLLPIRITAMNHSPYKRVLKQDESEQACGAPQSPEVSVCRRGPMCQARNVYWDVHGADKMRVNRPVELLNRLKCLYADEERCAKRETFTGTFMAQSVQILAKHRHNNKQKQLQGDKLTILRRTNEMRKHLADSSTSDGGRRNSIRHNGRFSTNQTQPSEALQRGSFPSNKEKQLQGDKLTILRRTNEMRKHLADSSTSDGGRRNSIRHNGRFSTNQTQPSEMSSNTPEWVNVERIFCFPMDNNDPKLRKTDRVYESADKKSVLLLREYMCRFREKTNDNRSFIKNMVKVSASLPSEKTDSNRCGATSPSKEHFQLAQQQSADEPNIVPKSRRRMAFQARNPSPPRSITEDHERQLTLRLLGFSNCYLAVHRFALYAYQTITECTNTSKSADEPQPGRVFAKLVITLVDALSEYIEPVRTAVAFANAYIDRYLEHLLHNIVAELIK